MSNESKQILAIINQYGPIQAVDIVKKLSVSTKTVYKHLSRLLDEELIKKSGSTPRVFYFLNQGTADTVAESEAEKIIEENYVYISPSGELLRGLNGFQEWCRKSNLSLEKEIKNFILKHKTIQKIKKDGLLSAKKIILSGKKKLYLNNIFFSDFYTFDHFGKTKLGQLVYLGKSSQNKELISEVAKLIKPAIIKLIEKYDIKNICYIPPTIDRRVQFMNILQKKLALNLNEIKIEKTSSPFKVPQKTLRKLEDRIINAQSTIVVNINQKIKGNVLIIDDATGSGATLNEVSHKIRKITLEKIKIIGYSVVGSYKGFDVISEV